MASTAESRDFVRVSLEEVPVKALSTEFAPVEMLAVQTDIARNDEPVDMPVESAADDDNRIIQISGAALRQRLGQQNPAEKPASQPVAVTNGLLRRLFTRKVASR